nr:MAG: putative RNA-dependent RNA polymerase [Totiviridae sp.]
MCLKELASKSRPDRTIFKVNVDVETISFRCKADISTRRLKLSNLTTLPHFQEVIGWTHHLDQILVANLVIWTYINGIDKFHDLKRLGYLNSITDFINISFISSYVKRFPTDDGSKQIFAEINSLTGYLQNDIEEVDWHEKLSELANGGAEHGLPGEDTIKTFTDILNLICPPTTRPHLFIGFYDYIESGLWLTAGSSSIGKVYWETTTEKGHFKARKNMVTYLYTTDELYDLCKRWDGRLISRAFTKDELSKRRIAVASNIESYLCESYLLYNMTHVYKSWKYITLDESPAVEHNRTIEVSKLLKSGKWALPFDFKNFDHQPTTEEIQTIMSHDLNGVDVPKQYLQEWNNIKYKVINSYSNNTMSMSINNKKVELDVKGGLPSGVRWTSLIGNQWNMVMSQWARNITTKILGYDPVLTMGIKGDDTYIIASRAVDLCIFREAYAMINAIGLNSKFGIQKRVCEFLRVEISGDRARGWTNRSIPTITQRKPWNAEPWTIGSGVEAVAQSINTTERRCYKSLTELHTINKTRWSKHFGLSTRWLELPRIFGGFGVYPWNYYKPSEPLRIKNERPKVKFKDVVPYKELTWIQLTEDERKTMAINALTAATHTDDIRPIYSQTKHDILKTARKTKVRWYKYQPAFRISWFGGLETPDLTGYWPKFAGGFEQQKEALEIITDYSYLPNHIKQEIPLIKALQDYAPAFAQGVKQYESRGWHRTDAINIGLGIVPTSTTFKLHPKMIPFVRSSLINTRILYQVGRKQILDHIDTTTQASNHAIQQSAGYKLYQY